MADRIIRGISEDGNVKIAVIDSRETVAEAKRIHNTSTTATAAFGRALTAAALLGNALKESESSLSLIIDGGGPIGSIVCVSDSSGNVRGCVGNPLADAPEKYSGKLDVGAVVGTNGLLTVIKDLNLKEPYVGSSMLVSGEIAEDVTAYLLESEQVPSACGLGVLIDTDSSITASGGFIVQLLPGAAESIIDVLEGNIGKIGSVTDNLINISIEDYAAKIMDGIPFKLFSAETIAYKCNCSRERISEALLSIGKKELQDMAEEDIRENKNTEVSCQFCDRLHVFTSDDLFKLINGADDGNEENNN